MVEQQLAMLYTGVRFSSPAPLIFVLTLVVTFVIIVWQTEA